jgi:hypothetical protein
LCFGRRVSVASRWVRSEAAIADGNKALVPVTIAPCDRPVMFELTQTADLSHWRGQAVDKAWLAFFDYVRRMVGRESMSATPVSALASKFEPANAARAKLLTRFGWTVIGICALLPIAGAGFVVTRQFRQVSATPVAGSTSAPSIAVLPFANLSPAIRARTAGHSSHG